MARRAPSPHDILLPYQRDWVDDAARFKIGLWARQTGKSFSTAAEPVEDCLTRKTTWVCLSAGERQALEWMRKARDWAEAWKVAISGYQELRPSAEALLKSAEIEWPNGSRIIAIPANPDTARGYSANLVLDEFAFHEQPDAIWRAIYPSISNPLKGTFRLRIVSTPNGQGNKFHDLWTKENRYSKHKVDIHTAIARGLPLDVEELRAGLDDAEGWAQEYMCQFLDAAAVLLPYELIALNESAEASEHQPVEFWRAAHHEPLFLGIDFGRKKNLTVAWTASRIGDVGHTREVLTLHNTSTPDQVEILAPRIEAARLTSVDYTGPGVGLGDELVRRYGLWDPEQHRYGRIELVTMSGPTKVDLFSKLRMAFEGQRWRIPASRVIREDLHSMHRVVTPSGNISYRAPHTADGHADRCVALALCHRAMASGWMPFSYSRVPRPPRGARSRRRRVTA